MGSFFMKTEEKKLAIKLRKKGLSIKKIAKDIGVSKSSVSLWVRNIQLDFSQQNKLKNNQHTSLVVEKRRQTRLSNELQKRQNIMKIAGHDIDSISKKELLLIGASLYWGEGSKKGKRVASVANSDPVIIKIMMRFFKEVCGVSNEKFRGHIHTYSHLNSSVALKYWSNISGIPINQFYKTYIKQSIASKNKKDRLPYGTMDIYVCDVKVFLNIMGWIEKIKELLIKENK